MVSHIKYNGEKTSNTNTAPGSSDGQAPEALSFDQLEIKEYKYEPHAGGYTLWFLVITNNSAMTPTLSFNATAYDESNNMIGAASTSVNVIAPGETTICNFYFAGVTGIDHIEYTGQYGSSRYSPVISNLSVESNVNGKVLVLNVKNTGDYSADFVECHALFMDSNDNVVYHTSTYFTDADYQIKPGNSISKQLNAYTDFDHVDWYFSGRH